jgi:tetratricopeptide (TPR) repeat protein
MKVSYDFKYYNYFNVLKGCLIIKMINSKLFKISGLILLLIMFLGCQSNPIPQSFSDSPKANDLIFLAHLNEQSQSYQKAIEIYLELSYIDSPPIWAEKASRLAIDKNFNELALESTHRWLAIEPDEFTPKAARLIALLRASSLDEFKNLALIVIEGASDPGFGMLLIAQALRAEDNFVLSLPVFKAINQIYEDNAESAYVLSVLCLQNNLLSESLIFASRANHLKPDWKEAAIHYSSLLFLNQQVIEGYKIGFQATGSSVSIDEKISLGETLIQTGNSLLAKNYFLKLNSLYPDDLRVMTGLGITNFSLGRTDDASLIFTNLTHQSAYRDQANYFLGLIAYENFNYQQAFRFFSRVTDGLYFIRAHQLASDITANVFGDLEGSISYLSSLQTAYPNYDEELELAKIFRLVESSEFERAQKIALNNKNKANTEIDFAIIYTEVSTAYISSLILYDNLNAFSKIEIVIHEVGANFQLLLLKSNIEQNLNRLNDAIATLKLCLDFEPESPLVLNAIGYLLTDKLNMHDEAYQYITKALEGNPDNPAIQDSMGWVLFNLERYNEALPHLERAHSSFNDPEVIYHLIRTYQQIGSATQYEYYKSLLLLTYPESHFTKIIR